MMRRVAAMTVLDKNMSRSPGSVKVDEFYSRPHQDMPVYKPSPELEHQVLGLPCGDGIGARHSFVSGLTEKTDSRMTPSATVCEGKVADGARAKRGDYSEFVEDMGGDNHHHCRTTDVKLDRGDESNQMEVTTTTQETTGLLDPYQQQTTDPVVETETLWKENTMTWSSSTVSFSRTVEHVLASLASMVLYLCLLYLILVVMVTLTNKTIVFKPFFSEE